MPTTSQAKVLAHVTGKSSRDLGKVLKPVQIEPSHHFTEAGGSVDDVDEDEEWPVSPEDQVTTAISADQQGAEERTLSGQTRFKQRLHHLGFWKAMGRRDSQKKIGVPVAEKPPDAAEYEQKIAQEVEKVVQEKVKRPSTRRREPPTLCPAAICFEMKSSATTHTDVLRKMKDMLYYKRGSSIVSVQFIPKSRWIIVMDSQETRDRLAGMEVVFESHCVLLRRYDDVMRTDYKQYLRRIGLLELINNGK